jgi:hypothetical protein
MEYGLTSWTAGHMGGFLDRHRGVPSCLPRGRAARATQTASKIDLMLRLTLRTAVANLLDRAWRAVPKQPREQIYGAIASKITGGESELGRFTSTVAP